LVTSDKRATVVLNIGADNTDLVVCTRSAVWQRCILLGGNSFTRAISDAFRLNFEKAEQLKRKAPMSKYDRQIFQAMKPVFTDLGSEIQRSLGFYNNSNPDTKIVRIIALGGGTKLPRLLKYLQQTLQIPVERPDSFKRLGMGPGISPVKFHENVCDFGVVYGLALQGLGIARIESNLLPRTIARSMAWASKGKYFIAAACMLLAVSLLCFARTGLDKMNYNKNIPVRDRTGGILAAVQQAKEKLQEIEADSSEYKATIEKELEPFKYREMIPSLYEIIISALPNEKNNPQQAKLYQAFAKGDVEGILEIPRKDRKQIFITNMSAYFTSDLDTAQFDRGADLWRRSRGMPGVEGEEYEGMYEEYDYERMQMEMMGPQYQYAPGGIFAQGQTTEEKKPGFVATIAGYSPYGKVAELMDPHDIEDKQDKWGMVTRLLHLDDFAADGKSPFELFKKTDPEQFKLEIGEVSLEAQLPAGIGVTDIRYRPTSGQTGQEESAEWILIDPMTRETISKIAEWEANGQPKLDPRRGTQVYTVNDHWFVLNVKFVWRDAPESVKAKAPAFPPYMMGRTGLSQPATPQSTGSTPTRGRDLTTGIE